MNNNFTINHYEIANRFGVNRFLLLSATGEVLAVSPKALEIDGGDLDFLVGGSCADLFNASNDRCNSCILSKPEKVFGELVSVSCQSHRCLPLEGASGEVEFLLLLSDDIEVYAQNVDDENKYQKFLLLCHEVFQKDLDRFDKIANVVQLVLSLLGAKTCTVYSFDDEINNVERFKREGDVRRASEFDDYFFPLTGAPWFASNAIRNKIVFIEDTKNPPANFEFNEFELAMLNYKKVDSFLSIPVSHAKKPVYVITVEFGEAPKNITALKAVASSLQSTIQGYYGHRVSKENLLSKIDLDRRVSQSAGFTSWVYEAKTEHLVLSNNIYLSDENSPDCVEIKFDPRIDYAEDGVMPQPKALPAILDLVESVSSVGEISKHSTQFQFMHSDGVERWVEMRISWADKSMDGRVDTIKGILLDINELKEMEIEAITASGQLAVSLSKLRSAQDHLVESEKQASLGRLVAGVAHELNTPIGIAVSYTTFVQGLLEKLMSSYEKGVFRKSDFELFCKKAAESVSGTIANLDRAAVLVRDFKQVAVDQSSEAKRMFELREYIGQAMHSMRAKWKHSKHNVVLLEGEQVEMESYPGAIVQVMLNLITNSLKHGFKEIEAGLVEVSVEQLETNVVISFRDNGCGMDEHTRTHLFDPFFTTARNEGGSGLGTHIVMNLVTQTLKGKINVESSVGVGSEFVITIPTHV